MGFCSRAQARELILSRRVRLNGRVCSDPEASADQRRDQIEVDGQRVVAVARHYIMLNKPRGLVTTREDEQGRPTVYQCLVDAGLPWLSPVGRLDKASEGLLLFTNDTRWADRLLDPESHVSKRYHVQVNCLADQSFCKRLVQGVVTDEGDRLAAGNARLLRFGTRNSWLEITLAEGKNRHIRRLLEECGIEVLRLVRVAIGDLELGTLAKGQLRPLTATEVRSLASAASEEDER